MGTDSFTYQAYDHVSWGNSATVTITITNPSPVADDDAYAGGLDGLGEASFGSVLDNDSEPNDTWLEVADYTSASEGSVTVDPDGTIYYSAPSPEFTGIVTFTYRTWDHWTYSDPATVTLTITSPLTLSAPPVENSGAASVDADAARRFLVAAGQRWIDAGVNRQLVGRALESITVSVTDLPGAQLAGIHGSVIFVDHNAAGHGWFLDSTPGDDAEFSVATASGLRAGRNSPAYNHADLLTAVMHEMGHWFGLPHSDRPGNIMHDELDLGTRIQKRPMRPSSNCSTKAGAGETKSQSQQPHPSPLPKGEGVFGCALIEQLHQALRQLVGLRAGVERLVALGERSRAAPPRRSAWLPSALLRSCGAASGSFGLPVTAAHTCSTRCEWRNCSNSGEN